MSKDDWPREKNWKLVYTRSAKLARAKQLGFGYPKDSLRPESDGDAARLRVLFVCSRNQLRSPTAERVWRKHPALEVRSAGTSTSARRPVTAEDVRWADVIFVMEEKHRTRLVAEFTRLLAHKTMHVLDVPDDYAFMDPELVTEVTESVAAILDLDPP